MLRDLLAGEGFAFGSLHVATLMKRMRIEALYRQPSTSKPAPGHKIYPYLLRKLAVTRPDQVWAMDITYIPMARGFVYLAVVVDWFSRRVLAWRLSITMEAAFCVEALGGSSVALRHTGDLQHRSGQSVRQCRVHRRAARQGDRHQHGRQGAWRDNVFVEQLWRTIKYEEVYLRAYDTVSDARGSLGRYIAFYNSRRPHSSLDRQPPDRAYFNRPPLLAAA